jgi:hypothetical protein
MKCKTCGRNSEGEYCFQHKPRKPLSSGKKSTLSGKKSLSVGFNQQKSVISNKKAQNVQNNKQSSEMKQFFMNFWRTHKPHICENCEKPLGREPLSYMFDHVLEKSKYPELAFEEENIMYLCLECHDNKTRGHLSSIIEERIEYLKTKFNL